MGLSKKCELRGIDSDFYLKIDIASIQKSSDGECYDIKLSYSVYATKAVRESGKDSIFTSMCGFKLATQLVLQSSFNELFALLYSGVKDQVPSFSDSIDS